MLVQILLYPTLNPKSTCVWLNQDFPFDSQQTLECLAKEVEIQEFPTIYDFDELLPPLVGFRGGGESTDHVAFDLKSTLVSAEIMAT